MELPGKDDEFLCQADANGAHVEAQDPRICGALVDTHVQLLRIYETQSRPVWTHLPTAPPVNRVYE